jgi:hypothetical protein
MSFDNFIEDRSACLLKGILLMTHKLNRRRLIRSKTALVRLGFCKADL